MATDFGRQPMAPASPLDNLVRQASLRARTRTRPEPLQDTPQHPTRPSASASEARNNSQSPPRSLHSLHVYTGPQNKPAPVSPLLHTQFRMSTATTIGDNTFIYDEMNSPSWDQSSSQWVTPGPSDGGDDAYGGYEPSEASIYSASPLPSPLPIPGGRRQHHSSQAYASPVSSSPSLSNLDPTSAQPSPISPLYPHQQLRQPQAQDDFRESSLSGYSTNSRSLGVETPDNRNTWRSDISGSTNADAFAFRDYESPLPPKVVVTAPMTPRISLEHIPETGHHWNEEHGAEEDNGSTSAPAEPVTSTARPRRSDVSDSEPSANGRTRSLYNAKNFSRPIRSSAAVGPEAFERPNSMASAYSVASSASAFTAPPTHGTSFDTFNEPNMRTSMSEPGHVTIRHQRAKEGEFLPRPILRPASEFDASSSSPPSTSAVPSAAPITLARKPSIRFEDPRPPPPVPSPVAMSQPPLNLPTIQIRPASPAKTAPPPLGSTSQSQSRPNVLRKPSTPAMRAQVIELAKQRAPPPPPSGPSSRNNLSGGQAPLGDRQRSPDWPASQQDNRTPSPGNSVYSDYPYYDPDAIASNAPTPPPNVQSHLEPTQPPPASRSKSRGHDPTQEEEPKTAEDYLQLGINYHLANNLKESAYCFEISAKGIGALKGRGSVSDHGGSSSTHGRSSDAHDEYEAGCGVGMLMWGLALRSGWGVPKDEKKGFKWLRRAAEHAVEDLEMGKGSKQNPAIRSELVLAIYEVGQCFFHGWGVKKDEKMGFSYFQVASRLGDPDAQQELAFCLLNGKGCKKDKKEAAKWYRAAVEKGASDVGLAWIYKDKYM